MKKIYTGKYGPDSDGDGHNDKVDTCEDYPNPDQSIKEAEAAGSWCDENPYEYRAPLVKFLPGSKDIMVFWDLRYQSLDEDLRNEGATLIAFDEEGSFYKEGQALIFKGTSSKPHLSKEIYGTEIYSADFLAKEAGGHLLVINKGFVIDLDSQELVGYVNLRSNGSVNIRSLRGVSSEGMAVGINGRFVEMIKDIKGDPQLWLDYPLNLGGALGNTTDNLLQFAFGGDLLITESFIVDPFLHLLSDVLQSVRGEGISGGALSQSIDDTRGHSASPKKDQEEAKLFAEEIAEINTIYSLNGQEIDLKSCLSEEIDIKLSERAVSLFDYIVLGLSGYGIYCGDLEARFADVNGEGDYYDFVEDRLLKGYWSEYMFSEDEYGPTMVVAKKYCEDLGNGWRLPNFYEAHSLVTNINRKVSDIAIHPIFTDVEWGSYGTHTGTMIGSDMTYWVSYGYGGGWMESSALEGTSHFRCFRPISD